MHTLGAAALFADVLFASPLDRPQRPRRRSGMRRRGSIVRTVTDAVAEALEQHPAFMPVLRNYPY
jgi:hypothetical protein